VRAGNTVVRWTRQTLYLGCLPECDASKSLPSSYPSVFDREAYLHVRQVLRLLQQLGAVQSKCSVDEVIQLLWPIKDETDELFETIHPYP